MPFKAAHSSFEGQLNLPNSKKNICCWNPAKQKNLVVSEVVLEDLELFEKVHTAGNVVSLKQYCIVTDKKREWFDIYSDPKKKRF